MADDFEGYNEDGANHPNIYPDFMLEYEVKYFRHLLGDTISIWKTQLRSVLPACVSINQLTLI